MVGRDTTDHHMLAVLTYVAERVAGADLCG